MNPVSGPENRLKYVLRSDLARLCLPAEFRDSHRILAYANSICALFVVIGLMGLKAPDLTVRPLSEVSGPVLVTIEQLPEPPPLAEPELKREFQHPLDVDTYLPEVAAPIAVADAAQVGFAVPIEGAVTALSRVKLATPPNRVNQAAPPAAATQFRRESGQEGITPEPAYPPSALRNNQQGTVEIEYNVDRLGAVISATIRKSSGARSLDHAALTVVKDRWRFPPGEPRYFFTQFTFKIQ
jgi:protein TonB